MLKVGLFIPCYVDCFYPKVGIATLELLEKFGCSVSYPDKQTCCGQPFSNSGYSHLAPKVDELFIENFKNCDYIVSPSGSCVLHVKDHLSSKTQQESAKHIRDHIYELTEFLTDIIRVENLQAAFPYRVGLHQSCHGQRGLYLSNMSERMEPSFSKPLKLLKMVDGIQLSPLVRPDECCGFGGTFCVAEEAVSVRMGQDRLNDHINHGVEVITATDMSCLMHLEGILKRQGSSVKIKHIAEILNQVAS